MDQQFIYSSVSFSLPLPQSWLCMPVCLAPPVSLCFARSGFHGRPTSPHSCAELRMPGIRHDNTGRAS
ncbi:uncharacterized protein LY79DRAFT_553867 [Colletotrichum navitas]|uniref:Uncharacterized protein n=1 Tax=Colletotrichum navitas TaxID=681940 RepID=A0AAD8Q024_9PEZI|nr:uncharacterized protein LY79DRAFT_553867 [Colletotrichum navitas]KAK1590739.1 hypothetical protein LY79DRAFT_553867 [Colletotrichum navitas]